MDSSILICTVFFEEITSNGDVLKRTLYKNAALTLGRNEFEEVILKLDSGKKMLKYNLRELVIHKRFAKEGKATVKLPDHRILLLLSNCPPDKLCMFLKTMSIKLECKKRKGFLSERSKLISGMKRTFQEISPLTMKDLQVVKSVCREGRGKLQNDLTPIGKTKKKYEDADCLDKENVPPLKLSRKDLQPVFNSSKLTKEQMAVFDAVKGGKNIFFTGSAGTGKSFLLKRILGALPPQHTFATASTGVAACHISGITLHAFGGIGSGRAPLAQCVELAARPWVAQQWKNCRYLIIDEISMVDGAYFDKLETVARVIRKNDSPFGGIQLVVCGDFLQLPPIEKSGEKRRFCFQSKAWKNCIDINMELTEVKRQSDRQFIDILQNIRKGRCPEYICDALTATASCQIQRNGIQATKLCTHKEDVDQLNNHHLKKLPATSRIFKAVDSDGHLTKQISAQCPVNQELELKIGTQVMLAKNLDVQRSLVNGARGVVTRFESSSEGWPVVKFLCGVEQSIKPTHWRLKIGEQFAVRKQIPLKLAWAISIHKSQGMTLDCVEICLARIFEAGQAYVALSRAKSLEGLCVSHFDKSCVRSNPDVLRFYSSLEFTRTSFDGYSKNGLLL